jgi:hypothetical protein
MTFCRRAGKPQHLPLKIIYSGLTVVVFVRGLEG